MTRSWQLKLETRLLRAWQHRGWLAYLLWPLSQAFGALTALRRTLYRWGWLRVEAVRVPVIVVGSVVVGGVGKTPIVMALVDHLRAQGWQVGVIARGHGRTTADCREVLTESLAQEVGDECLLIRQRTGAATFVAFRRIEAARALLAAYPATQVIVTDDGLQHLSLQRDLELCVLDGRGTGNGFLLPAGLLREPWPRPGQPSQPSLHRPTPLQWTVLTGNPLENAGGSLVGFRSTRQLATYGVQANGTRVTLAALAESVASGHVRLCAVAGIAQPEVFFTQLRLRGLHLADTKALPDHYNFDSFNSSINIEFQLICTEKDAVKLWKIDPLALAVPLEVELDPKLLTAVDTALQARLSSKS